MRTTTSEIITVDSGSRNRVVRSPDHVRIKRGRFLRLSPEDVTSKPWESRRRVAEARILAVAQTCAQPLVFTLYSALALWGIEGWVDNPDVTFRCEQRYAGSRLPRVRVGRADVAGVLVRQTWMARWTGRRFRRGDLWFDSLEDTALLFACTRHPLEAFVAVCGILRRLTGLDRWALRTSPDADGPIRERLLAVLDGRPGTRGIRTARRILRFASAQCDSVGERAFLWVLLSVCPEMPQLQHEVVVNGTRRFIDFAFPALRIALEFDGMGKLGDTEAEIVRNRRRMFSRDQDLVRAGWKVFHFTWDDFADFEVLRARLVELLGWGGVVVDPQRRGLWRPVPPAVGARDRRA